MLHGGVEMKKELVIEQKPPKGDDGHRVFSVRIKDDLCVRLESLAAQTGRSRNELIGLLLDFALDNCVVKPKD